MIAYRTARRLGELGHEVVVVTTSPASPAGEVFRTVSLPIAVPGWLRFWLGTANPRALRLLRDVFRRERPEVVHAHNVHTQLSFATLALAGQFTPKVFLTAHDPLLVHYDKLSGSVDPADRSPHPRVRTRVTFADHLAAARWRLNPFRGPLIRRYLRSVARVFAVSDALGRILQANGIPRVSTLHNGIDPADFSPDATRAHRPLPVPGTTGRPMILFAGRPTRHKGIQALRKAMERLQDHARAPWLLIAAPNARAPQWLQEGLALRAGFTPREMPAIYAEAAFVAVPSLYPDPFPTVNLEAGAAGRAVVGTCFGGTPEVVLDGTTGLIVNPFDGAALERAMRELLDDPARAAALGAQARRRIEAHFTLDQQVGRLLEWYRAIATAGEHRV